MAVITIYAGAEDSKPADAADLPWPEIAAELAGLANNPSWAPLGADVEVQKKCMVAWAPHALAPGATRGKLGVQHVSMLVVDVDHGGDPDVIAERLRAANVAGLLYESAKSTPEAPRFRIVCPITTPIAPDQCRETRTRLTEALGLDADCGVHGAIEAAKLFFSGRAHGTPERRVWLVEGEPIDPATLPPNTDAWRARAPAARPDASPHLAALPPADAGLVAALGPWQQHAGRKWSLCGAIGGLMRKLAYSSYQCEAVIREWLPPDNPGVDVEAGVSWALGAWQHDAADVSGFQGVEALLGTAHAEIVEKAALAGSFSGRAAARRPLARSAWLAFAPASDAGDPLGAQHRLDTDDGPIPYDCEGLKLAPSLGKVSLIGGLPGAGKGPIADYLAACWALGMPVFGRWPVVQQDVLLLDVEGVRLTKRRTRRMAHAMGRDPRDLQARLDLRDVSRTTMLDDRFFYALEAHPARIIVVDSYSSAMLATDLDPFKAEYAQLARMLAALDRLVLVVAHARKPSSGSSGERPTLADIAGSGVLGAMAQTALSVWRPNDDVNSHIRVGCARAPEVGFEMFDVMWCDTDGDGLMPRMISGEQVAAAQAVADTTGASQLCNAVLSWMRQHHTEAPHTRKVLRESVLVAGENPKEGEIVNVMARLVAANIAVAIPSASRNGSTSYQLRRLQDTPASVVIDGNGQLVTAATAGIAGFVRP